MISVWAGEGLLFAGATPAWSDWWRAAHGRGADPVPGVPYAEMCAISVEPLRRAALEALRTGRTAAVAWRSPSLGPVTLAYHPVRLADGSPAVAEEWRRPAAAPAPGRARTAA